MRHVLSRDRLVDWGTGMMSLFQGRGVEGTHQPHCGSSERHNQTRKVPEKEHSD
jgi:hypothetical protein